jgi:hypothetical protein
MKSSKSAPQLRWHPALSFVNATLEKTVPVKPIIKPSVKAPLASDRLKTIRQQEKLTSTSSDESGKQSFENTPQRRIPLKRSTTFRRHDPDFVLVTNLAQRQSMRADALPNLGAHLRDGRLSINRTETLRKADQVRETKNLERELSN